MSSEQETGAIVREEPIEEPPAAGHAGPLFSARCTRCKRVAVKRTARIVGETSSGSFKHVCHDCQRATWWNVLRVFKEVDR